MLRPTRVINEIIGICRFNRQIRRHGKSFIVQRNDDIVSIVHRLKLNVASVPFDFRSRLAVGNRTRQHQVLIFLYIYFVILFRDDCAIRCGFDVNGRWRCCVRENENELSFGEKLFNRKGNN